MAILDEFVRTHAPATYHRHRWRALLTAGSSAALPVTEAVPDAVAELPAMEIA